MRSLVVEPEVAGLRAGHGKVPGILAGMARIHLVLQLAEQIDHVLVSVVLEFSREPSLNELVKEGWLEVFKHGLEHDHLFE